MATCGSDSGIINVRRLPIVESIGAGDYIIVDSTLGETSILDFSNFIIGLEQTTFKPAFEQMQDDVNFFSVASADWEDTFTTVAANSAIWNKFDAAVFDIDCWDRTCVTTAAFSGRWETAYGWGDHATQGYAKQDAIQNWLTDETDPTVPSYVKNITSSEKQSWNTVYGFVGSVGVAGPNKMLIVDANRDITNIRNLNVTGEIRALGDVIAFDQGNPSPGGGSSTAGDSGITIYSSGWVAADAAGTAVHNGATLTFAHNLGTTDIITQLWISESPTGANAQRVNDSWVWSNNDLGYNISINSPNSVTVQLGQDGYSPITSNGQWSGGANFQNNFIKVVIVFAAGADFVTTGQTGAINKYVLDWTDAPGGVNCSNGSTHTITHNLGTEDVQVQVYARTGPGGRITLIDNVGHVNGHWTSGAQTMYNTANTIRLQTGASGFMVIDTDGSTLGWQDWSSHQMKVVIIG